MPCSVLTRAQVGITAPEVIVEAHNSNGTSGFSLVGLPQTAVKEARDRVKSAVKNAGFEFPSGRLVVNLSPADLVKQGGRYDLAIALAVLAATRQIDGARLGRFCFIGELSLYGEVRGVRGCFSAGAALRGSNVGLVLPSENAAELAILRDVELFPVATLTDVLKLLKEEIPQSTRPAPPPIDSLPRAKALRDVRGQLQAKRALLIAATGGHHMLMIGPPGTGKTMLAERLLPLLPEPTEAEIIEIANIHSAAGRRGPAFGRRPFRSPHHTASAPALVGGGNPTTPGEATLAHRGVLFLDELPEFPRGVLEALREPLESREIIVARLGTADCYPAAFQLIAAMNPCPAGYRCNETQCRCTPSQVMRYASRVSGPLLDRIDLHVEVGPVSENELFELPEQDDESRLREQVSRARAAQQRRAGMCNQDLGPADIQKHCALAREEQDLLRRTARAFALSARAVHRIQKVARSIADLAESEQIDKGHLSEAISFRAKSLAPQAG